MLLIYFSLMTLIALSFFIPAPSKNIFCVGLFMIVFSCGCYWLTGQWQAYQAWQMHGKKHYELMVQYEQLGGIDGIISRIKQKLVANPDDPEGWKILAKLYKAKGNSQHNKSEQKNDA